MTSPTDSDSQRVLDEDRVAAITRKNVETIARIHREAEAQRTIGERVADGFAHAIGSWPFILFQSGILIVWVIANVMRLVKPWDPYPFVLLNLALSFQAAYASPIIMMSQNRQGRLADERNHLALQVALIAEQEDTETLVLLKKICQQMQIPMEDSATEALLQPTDPHVLIQQIKAAVK